MSYTIKNPLDKLQQKDLEAILEKTERQIRRYDAEGLPGHGTGRGRFYVWAEVKPWWIARESGSRTAAGDPTDREREQKAKADIAEMEAASMAGTYIPRAAAVSEWTAFLGRLKESIRGIALRVAPRIEDGMILGEREAMIQREVDQTLRDVVAELARGDAE